MGLGYNIPISVSLAANSSAGGPFSDGTTINFSGFQTSTPTNSQSETQIPTATSSASNGGNAAAESAVPAVGGGLTAATPASYNQAGQSFLALSPSNPWLYVGIAAAVFGIFYLVKKHKI